MAQEYSDPGIAPTASKMVGQGIPGQVAPRGPIAPTAPDEGPIVMNSAVAQPSVYIPGASRHEIVHIDEGAMDQAMDYPVGTGSWQSKSHLGTVDPSDGPDGGVGKSKPMNVPAVPTVSTILGGRNV